MTMTAILALAALVACIGYSHAAVYSGNIEGKAGLMYLGDFCFDYDPTGHDVGQVTASITTADKGVVFGTKQNQACSARCPLGAPLTHHTQQTTPCHTCSAV